MIIKNFKYIVFDKQKTILELEPKRFSETDGQIVYHYEVTCPSTRDFVCSFDVPCYAEQQPKDEADADAPKKRGRPKKY